ncbi:hypothetical protein, partial [Corallococcus exercitus]|uniref:hypothetical protein n=1 Tax=Corallococcus exercitus TaxID=2316736 RepID=UPI001C10F2E0
LQEGAGAAGRPIIRDVRERDKPSPRGPRACGPPSAGPHSWAPGGRPVNSGVPVSHGVLPVSPLAH